MEFSPGPSQPGPTSDAKREVLDDRTRFPHSDNTLLRRTGCFDATRMAARRSAKTLHTRTWNRSINHQAAGSLWARKNLAQLGPFVVAFLRAVHLHLLLQCQEHQRAIVCCAIMSANVFRFFQPPGGVLPLWLSRMRETVLTTCERQKGKRIGRKIAPRSGGPNCDGRSSKTRSPWLYPSTPTC